MLFGGGRTAIPGSPSSRKLGNVIFGFFLGKSGKPSFLSLRKQWISPPLRAPMNRLREEGLPGIACVLGKMFGWFWEMWSV